MKPTTLPRHDSFLSSTFAAAVLAAGLLGGCDTSDGEPGDRALELDDEDLTDEEIDELVAEQDAEQDAERADEADEAAPSAAPETVAETMVIDSDRNGQIDPSDELVAASDPVAIGEMACATQALTDPIDGAVVAMTQAPNCGYAYDSSTSPNSSYDTAVCPHQYVTEVTGTSGEALSAFWGWHGGGLNATNCDLAHANLTFYGATWNLFTGTSWTKIGGTAVHGVWIDGPLFDYCSWQYDAGKGPIPSLAAGHNYYKVRTAAQATGFILKVPVEGGVWHGDGPC